MYSPLVEGGLGLFDLDLPPPPPAWLSAELARLVPPEPPAHSSDSLSWSLEPSDEHYYPQSFCNTHTLPPYSMDTQAVDTVIKQTVCETHIGKLEEVYSAILKKMEEKANTLDSRKVLSKIPLVFTSNHLQDRCAGNIIPPDEINIEFTTVAHQDTDSNFSTENLDETHTNSSRQELLHMYPDYFIFKKGNFCGFCRSNGEMPETYYGHSLRDSTGLLTCAVLRNYVCPKCGGTGDNAHTAFYCPHVRRNGCSPLATKLKRTKRNATSMRIISLDNPTAP